MINQNWKAVFASIIIYLGLYVTPGLASADKAISSAVGDTNNFITIWDLSKEGISSDKIFFSTFNPTGPIAYSWQVLPDGETGTGTFEAGSDALRTIQDLPANAKIRLEIAPTHLERFYVSSGSANGLVDVEQWGTASWTSMENAFNESQNLDITATDMPDLSQVSSLSRMFSYCKILNGPATIKDWNTGNVTNMSSMFEGAEAFNQDIRGWNTSNVTSMSSMFDGAVVFNQPIGSWNTANVTDMLSMFQGATAFSQDLSNWNTGNVTSMSNMFRRASAFNSDISNWNTGNVTSMSNMFRDATAFNQDISGWNTEKVESMAAMFREATLFNQNISSWNTEKVGAMWSMFSGATSFNQDISSWNTANVSDMSGMFLGATAFNQDISRWNTEKVESMAAMFRDATVFNQNISSWNTASVSDMSSMFAGASAFNQNLGTWSLNLEVDLSNMLDDSGLDCANYSATLIGWAENSPGVVDITLGANGLSYGTNAAAARTTLTTNRAWSFLGDMAGTEACELITYVGNWEQLVGALEDEDVKNIWFTDDIVAPSTFTLYGRFSSNGRVYFTRNMTVNGQGHSLTMTQGEVVIGSRKDQPNIYFKNLEIIVHNPSWRNPASAYGILIGESRFFADSIIVDLKYTGDPPAAPAGITTHFGASPGNDPILGHTVEATITNSTIKVYSNSLNPYGFYASAGSTVTIRNTTFDISRLDQNNPIQGIAIGAQNDLPSNLYDVEGVEFLFPILTIENNIGTGSTSHAALIYRKNGGEDNQDALAILDTIFAQNPKLPQRGALLPDLEFYPYVPDAPDSLKTESGDGQLEISFTAGDDGGSAITNYEYSLDGGKNWVAFDPAATVSPVTISGLDNGTEYSIRLRAVNAIGAGASSDEIKGTPKRIISAKGIEIAPVTSMSYTGAAIEPALSIKDGDKVLISGTDYTLEYTDNVNAGIASVTVTGKGAYTDTVSVIFTIDKAKVTITADNKQRAFGEDNPELTFTYDGLVGDDTNIDTEPTISTEATVASAVGEYPITLKGGADDNYEIELVNGTLTVGKAKVTITADDRARTYGFGTPALTFTYSGLTNGDTRIEVEPTISTPATDSSPAGIYPIELSGGSDPNYEIELVNGTLIIGRKALTIRADDRARTYGFGTPALTFTYEGLVNGDTGIEVEPTISTPATDSSPAGIYPIELSGGSDPNYTIRLENGTLIIGRKALTITADDKSKTYGEENPELTFTYTGLVNGDTKVGTEPSIATTATASSAAGEYPITLNGGEDDNYSITLVNGTLTVGKKALTITADDKQKTYGEANPALTFTYEGLVNGDTQVATEPSIVTTATTASAVGEYPITLNGGEDDNYAITLVNGTLTVGKKALTIRADDKQKTYGEENPELTFTYAGLVNGDTQVTTEPSIATTATAISDAGDYPITLNGGEDDNYAITLVNGTLTVGKKALTITADDKSKTYGEENPELTFTYTGLTNGDTQVATEPSIATMATTASVVGAYPITLVGGEDANYEIELVAGTLTIGKKLLLITAEDQEKIFGREDPVLSYRVSGLTAGDGESVISGELSREPGEEVGSYPILVGTLDAGPNYELAFTGGVLEIVPAVLSEVLNPELLRTPWSVLPDFEETVRVLTADGQEFEIGVSWDISTLDVFRRGLYFVSGTLSLPAGILNASNSKAVQQVEVLPKPAPLDVTLSNNVFEGSANNFFITVGAFQVNDPVDNVHEVTLFGQGYDNQYFEIRDNILFWSSADRAEGRTSFTILVRVTDRDGNTLDKFFEVSRTRKDINEIEVFNAFTPDGDGVNDTWGVPGIRFYRSARVQVFDRSGVRVFYTEDPDQVWNGSFGGKELPTGAYTWVLEVGETGEKRMGILYIIRD